ncbi:LysR family transcriptional regulator [Kushneria aurantia]|uniref:LysR family transcriptional regulator n=1 Tax=Kushneria aurantia TaxID=504092 RepID=A0ABV6G823_9GAMM|nr:LysR family transcriptional regulator [Kushneria aurantia]
MAQDIPAISLEQWVVLQALVEEGSFAGAAERLDRSQSSVSYALRGLQQQLPVPVLTTQGRRTVITPAGEALLRRASTIIEEALSLEQQARNLADGWEPEVRLVVEEIFPPALLSHVLANFAPASRDCRVQLVETMLSGTLEALFDARAELAITHQTPPGLPAQPLLTVAFVAVASPAHPLHRLGREVSSDDLRGYRQFVVRDSGLRRQRDAGRFASEQRWTVSHLHTSIRLVCDGLGFAWLPIDHIGDELAADRLRRLPLIDGEHRSAELFLVHSDRRSAGPATTALADALVGACRRYANG